MQDGNAGADRAGVLGADGQSSPVGPHGNFGSEHHCKFTFLHIEQSLHNEVKIGLSLQRARLDLGDVNKETQRIPPLMGASTTGPCCA